MPRTWVKPIAIVLLAVGAVFAGMAVVYLALRASDLPSWLPGHHDAIRTKSGHVIVYGHLKTEILAFGVMAAGALLASWWLAFRYEPND